MRVPVVSVILFAATLLAAPVHAAGEPRLDEITIRIIDDEDTPIDINDIALPPANGKRRGPASENADERAFQGSGNALEASEKAAQAASGAAMRAAQAREQAAEAGANNGDKALEAAESASEAAFDAAMRAAQAREKAAEAAETGKNRGNIRNN